MFRCRNFCVVDGGGSKFYIRNGLGVDDYQVVSRQGFLSLDWVDEGHCIVGEYAHLQVPQTPRSLSQPFSREELHLLHDRLDERGIEMYLFPEKLTSLARNQCCRDQKLDSDGKVKKGDPVDTLAIMRWVMSRNTLLQKSFRPRDRDVDADNIVAHTNKWCNAARSRGYSPDAGYFTDGIDHACELMLKLIPKEGKGNEWIVNAVEESKYAVSDQIVGVLKEVNYNFIYPAFCLVHDPDGGGEVLRSDGTRYSTDELVRYAIGHSANHGRMGVARSNVYYGFAKHRIIRENGKCKHNRYDGHDPEWEALKKTELNNTKKAFKKVVQVVRKHRMGELRQCSLFGTDELCLSPEKTQVEIDIENLPDTLPVLASAKPEATQSDLF
jgi:hypothetical protein